MHIVQWRSGQVLPMPYGQTLKDRATELPIKYKSGALVTVLPLSLTLHNCVDDKYLIAFY